jgi:hypothetical protein
MKKKDARIQVVTESKYLYVPQTHIIMLHNLSAIVMGVIRMIKLFGWEQRMAKRVFDKREEELVWIKRRQVLQIFNGVIKWAIFYSPNQWNPTSLIATSSQHSPCLLHSPLSEFLFV